MAEDVAVRERLQVTPLPPCPTCSAALQSNRVLDDVREYRLADGSQRLELTGEVDAEGNAILGEVEPHSTDTTIRVWVFTVSCGGCLSSVRVEMDAGGTPTPTGPRLVTPASEIARLRERLVRARDEGRLEAELNSLRLSDQFRLLGIPELWHEARGVIPDEMRLVVNAGWKRAPPVSPIGSVPATLEREKFRATAHPSLAFASGGGLAMQFHAFLAGTRFRILGVRRGLLRVVPVESVPDVYEVPSLCASWSLFGRIE